MALFYLPNAIIIIFIVKKQVFSAISQNSGAKTEKAGKTVASNRFLSSVPPSLSLSVFVPNLIICGGDYAGRVRN